MKLSIFLFLILFISLNLKAQENQKIVYPLGVSKEKIIESKSNVFLSGKTKKGTDYIRYIVVKKSLQTGKLYLQSQYYFFDENDLCVKVIIYEPIEEFNYVLMELNNNYKKQMNGTWYDEELGFNLKLKILKKRIRIDLYY